MKSLTEIHNFAVKYFDLYRDSYTTKLQVTQNFETQCSNLGFEIDGGQALINQYSAAEFDHAHYLAKVIAQITDYQLLGNAIFSYYARCQLQQCSPLADHARLWFLLAFEQLAKITSLQLQSPYLFEGELQKISLVSDLSGYGYYEKGLEVQQHLTININGQVELKRYV
ncbi:hypothetical protein [Bombilactobacillus bombi]|uniref:hypothetical protein n=1 Tax=Bombilactobacillus bombi TaxID=1303590 RepID=UPI0015E613A4|nr:hypothetical protein [Bombilactobacillus bombi]MBA1434964.1 hypothetical protein [Bombilactobacillus bombi]